MVYFVSFVGGSLVQSVIGGKPIHIGGKPFAQAKGLVQLSGKGGQHIGLIRTPQGPLSTINLIPAVSSASGKTATVVGKDKIILLSFLF